MARGYALVMITVPVPVKTKVPKWKVMAPAVVAVIETGVPLNAPSNDFTTVPESVTVVPTVEPVVSCSLHWPGSPISFSRTPPSEAVSMPLPLNDEGDPWAFAWTATVINGPRSVVLTFPDIETVVIGCAYAVGTRSRPGIRRSRALTYFTTFHLRSVRHCLMTPVFGALVVKRASPKKWGEVHESVDSRCLLDI